MISHPHASLAPLRFVWSSCTALLLLSLHAVALPPGASRPEGSSGIDNRAPAPQPLGTSTVAFTTSMEVLNETTKLGAGDRVSFRVLEDRREPIALVVTDSGEMEVPLVGRVSAMGKTCKQLAYEIKPLFEKEYFVRATVIIGLDQVGTKSRGKVYLTGQVRAPGVLELLPGDRVTVSQAILRAQGLADFANKREVRLVRKREGMPEGGSAPRRVTPKKQDSIFGKVGNLFRKQKEEPNESTETIIVDLVDILEKGHLERDPELKPGDLIVVPERLVNF
jgi:protein involved in polysaccharide export with SLBB domain